MQSITIELINRARNGNVEAIGELYDIYHRDVFSYLYYRTSDRQLAEDLTSEVFLKMIKAIPAFRISKGSFRGWLLQIAHNLMVDYYRQKPHQVIALEIEADPKQEISEELLERNMTLDKLQKALCQLAVDQREVIILRFIENLPINEVSKILRKSEDSIKGLQRRGLISLRQILSEEVVIGYLR